MKQVIASISVCLVLGSHFPAVAGGPEPSASDMKKTDTKSNEYQALDPNGRGRKAPKSVIDEFNPAKNNKARSQNGAPIEPQQPVTNKNGKLILKLTPQQAEDLHRRASGALSPDHQVHLHHHCSAKTMRRGDAK